MTTRTFLNQTRPVIEEARALLDTSDEGIRDLARDEPSKIRGLAQQMIDDAQNIASTTPDADAFAALERLASLGTVKIANRTRAGGRRLLRLEVDIPGEADGWDHESETLEEAIADVTHQIHRTLTERANKLTALADRLEPLEIVLPEPSSEPEQHHVFNNQGERVEVTIPE